MQAFTRNCRNQNSDAKGEAQAETTARRAYRRGALGRTDPYERGRPCNGAGAKGSGQVVVFSETTGRQDDVDRYDKQAVHDRETASVRSLQSGQIQWWSGRCGWADDRAVRSRLEGQPLQDLEQNELGKLLSTAGARRLHSEKIWRPADFGRAHRKR